MSASQDSRKLVVIIAEHLKIPVAKTVSPIRLDSDERSDHRDQSNRARTGRQLISTTVGEHRGSAISAPPLFGSNSFQ
jgi:hypothetical protein